MTAPSPANNRFHAKLKRAAAVELFRRYPVEKKILWPMVREQIRAERGITCNVLYTATYQKVISIMVADREEEWHSIRAMVRPRIEAETGWVDHRKVRA